MTGRSLTGLLISAMYRRDFNGWGKLGEDADTFTFVVDAPYLSLTAVVDKNDALRQPTFGVETSGPFSLSAHGLVPKGLDFMDVLRLKGEGFDIGIRMDDADADTGWIAEEPRKEENISNGPAPVFWSEPGFSTLPAVFIPEFDKGIASCLVRIAAGTPNDDDMEGRYSNDAELLVEGLFRRFSVETPVVRLFVRYGDVEATIRGTAILVEGGVTVFSESARIFVPIPEEMVDAALSETHDEWNSTREYVRRNPPRDYRRDIPDFESIVKELRDENVTE